MAKSPASQNSFFSKVTSAAPAKLNYSPIPSNTPNTSTANGPVYTPPPKAVNSNNFFNKVETASSKNATNGAGNPQVVALQNQLNAEGANLKVDGIMGPATTAAMNQHAINTTGTPHTQTVIDSDGQTTAQIKALQQSLNQNGANITVDGVMGPETLAAMNDAATKSLAANPAAATLTTNNTPAAILNAYQTGDWSGVTDASGQPFSQEAQQAAVAKATSQLAPGFQAQQTKDTADTAATLQANQNTEQNFLQGQRTAFNADKENLDTNSAQNGVLFAGSRVKANNLLGQQYTLADKTEQQPIAASSAATARNYQSQYGTAAASNPTLSQYYGLPGGNSYNVNAAQNGAQPSSANSLSAYYNPSTYNPSQPNYAGTTGASNTAAIQTNAAGLLANQANKISTTGYQNQF